MIKEKTTTNKITPVLQKDNYPDRSEFSSSLGVLPVFIELSNNVIKRIEPERICYIHVECMCSTFYLDDNSRLNSLKSLQEIEKMLSSNFIRIHRNCIVNILKISEFQIRNRNVILTNGKQLMVSFRNVKGLLERLSSKY